MWLKLQLSHKYKAQANLPNAEGIWVLHGGDDSSLDVLSCDV